MTASGWLYLLLGGWRLAYAPLEWARFPYVVLPILVLALTSFAMNTALVSGAVSISEGIAFLRVWVANFSWTTSTQIALAVLGLAIAEVVRSEGLVALALFIVPLLVARLFFTRYTSLRNAYADMVRCLVAAIEAKDSYTRGHSERVATYAVAIARAVSLSESRIERLELAALLHDLGKVGISRRILWKQERLSSDEFEEIRRHPEIGAHIIESVPSLADLAPIIRSHHERPDGKGYGEGLRQEAIPLEARILAVADSYDAMTSNRPYRSPLPVMTALDELRAVAGTQLDATYVRVFVQLLEEDGRVEVPIAEAVQIRGDIDDAI